MKSARRFAGPAALAVTLSLSAPSCSPPSGGAGGVPAGTNPSLAPANSSTASTAGADANFDARWHDGKGEIAGYRLTIDRYGNPRAGQGVMITVTEPFSKSKHVKLDDPSKNPSDSFDALKLNFVRRFQTGIYDYNTMVSLFTRSVDFSPVKVAFSGSEWCGQVYEELIFESSRVSEKFYSYFEDQSAEKTIAAPPEGIEEDNLFILLRGLRGDFLPQGGKREAPFLPGPLYRRMRHEDIGWSLVTIERGAAEETVKVPAGSFETIVYTVRPKDGRVGRFDIEAAEPHRVIRWEWTPPASAAAGREHFMGGTDRGELTGAKRLEYWNLHDPGDEKYLEDLGLHPVMK